MRTVSFRECIFDIPCNIPEKTYVPHLWRGNPLSPPTMKGFPEIYSLLVKVAFFWVCSSSVCWFTTLPDTVRANGFSQVIRSSRKVGSPTAIASIHPSIHPQLCKKKSRCFLIYQLRNRDWIYTPHRGCQ